MLLDHRAAVAALRDLFVAGGEIQKHLGSGKRHKVARGYRCPDILTYLGPESEESGIEYHIGPYGEGLVLNISAGAGAV